MRNLKTTAKPPRTATPRPRRTLRLPGTIVAKTIELHLELDPRSRSFRGQARYALEVAEATNSIELHSAELAVRDVECVVGGCGIASEPIKGRVEAHPECETILLRFDRTLDPGSLSLSLRFRGRVRDDLRGLYRGSDRKTPWLASQLCPTDARRLFPCFDEPGTKACYSISVSAPADQVVLSNAPIKKRSPILGGKRTTYFEPTPPLSVYLVAVAVGPFEVSRIAYAGSTPIRVITLPGKRALGRFAREAAVESLVRLEKWFGMPHPYAKLDLLALPDFAFGAMENAGAVYFRDSVLLLDEKEATAEDQTRAAETIAHELAHMWFGNLVTMAWWNDLWLNESFATWMAYEIVNDWKPEWRMWHEFIARRESALELDALASSHPIAPPIRTADEAQENFDAITYTKGASVLRMLERFLGPRVFRNGVRRYIRAHREGAATASDLWSALEAASNLPIEEIVAPWTDRTGFPIVLAKRTADGKKFQLSQERFLLRPTGKAKAQSDPPWQIPWIGVFAGVKRGALTRRVLTRKREKISLPAKHRARPIYANGEEAGFFRIDHGSAGHEALVANVDILAPIERIGWVGHQWALVRAGRAQIASLLDLLAALGDEADPDVLFSIERVLSQMLQRLAPDCGPETRDRLRAWITLQFGRQLEAVSLQPTRGETRERTQRRAHIISMVGVLGGSVPLMETCLELAAVAYSGGRALPRGAEENVLRVAAATDDRALQRAMIAAIRTAETPQARRRPLFALASFAPGPGLDRTLRASLDRKLAPAVDRATLLMLLLGGRQSAAPTWAHLQSCWPRLEAEMPPILLGRLAAETARALPLEETKQIRPFFEANPLAAGTRVLRQIAEEVAIAKQVRRHALKGLRAYLGG